MKKYFLCLIAGLMGSLLVSLPLAAEEYYGNFSSEEEIMGMAALESIDLPFDPNDYSFLIYVPNGGEDSIEQAMTKLGISYDKRDKNNIVTANDLATHDILIVGWNAGGYTTGLVSNILEAGITGRIILGGHDLDYHTAPPLGYESNYREAAERMFIQAIDFILKGSGTGMLTLGDAYYFGSPAFTYLPTSWGVTAVTTGSQTVTEFTFEGLDSGIYDNLTPQQMCGWDTSYHDAFTIDPNSAFVSFELGPDGPDADQLDDIITVARINPYGLSLEIVDGFEPETCVSPTDEITYTITWSRPAGAPGDPGPLTIVDYLPPEVDYPLAMQDPNYDILTHTYTWTVDELDPGDSVTKYLTVTVNTLAEPLGVLVNRVAIYNSEGLLITMLEATPVCCWGGDMAGMA